MPDWVKRIKELQHIAEFGPPCPKCGHQGLRADGWCEDCGEDMVSTAIKGAMSEAHFKKHWQNEPPQPEVPTEWVVQLLLYVGAGAPSGGVQEMARATLLQIQKRGYPREELEEKAKSIAIASTAGAEQSYLRMIRDVWNKAFPYDPFPVVAQEPELHINGSMAGMLAQEQIEKAMGLPTGSLKNATADSDAKKPTKMEEALGAGLVGFDLAVPFKTSYPAEFVEPPIEYTPNSFPRPLPNRRAPTPPAKPKKPSVEEKIDQAPRRAKLELD